MALGFDSMSPDINRFSLNTQKVSFCWFNFVECLQIHLEYTIVLTSLFYVQQPLGYTKTHIQENPSSGLRLIGFLYIGYFR